MKSNARSAGASRFFVTIALFGAALAGCERASMLGTGFSSFGPDGGAGDAESSKDAGHPSGESADRSIPDGSVAVAPLGTDAGTDLAKEPPAPDPPDQGSYPRTFHTAKQIAFVQEKLTKKVEPFWAAYNQFLAAAAVHVSITISAVPDLAVPSSTEDPAANEKARTLLSRQAEAAYVLALSARLGVGQHESQKQSYADKAAQIVREWARTNVSYSGTDGDYVVATRGVGLALAADLLWDHPLWSQADRTAMRSWLRVVLEKASVTMKKRNHGRAGWGVLAALVAHGLLNDEAGLDEDIARLTMLIDERIQPDGALPTELVRADQSLWSTFDALASLTAALEVTRNLRGRDLYVWTPPDGGTVKKALDYFFQKGCLMPNTWPIPDQRSQMRSDRAGGNLIAAMGVVYSDPAYLEWAKHPIWYPGNGLPWAAASLMPPLRQ
jgi:hypothetical protein